MEEPISCPMYFIKGLFTFLSVSLLVCFFTSCSDKKEETEDEPNVFVLINGVEHRVVDTGYIFSGVGAEPDHDIWLHLMIEDRINGDNQSAIEFRLPLEKTEKWFHLKECDSYWKVILRSLHVGDHTCMNLISSGKILIRQLGEKDTNDDCTYQVAFDITLTDGTKVVADVQTVFMYGNVPVSGR